MSLNRFFRQGLAAAALGLAALAAALPAHAVDTGLEDTGLEEAFSLPATDGLRATPERLAGRPYLLFFGFTHCPDICPTALSELALRLEELGPRGDALRVIFVTVDPARDTLAHLRDYVGWFDPRIIALSGSAAETATIARAFRASYARRELGEGDYAMDHTAAFFLVDATGALVGTIDPRSPPEVQRAGLERLLAAGPGG